MTFDPFAASLGVAFVPVDPRSKTPYHTDWPTVSFTPEMFRAGDNQGGIWGDRSDGLVDIDHDTLPACAAGKRVFTSGPCYGRRSKRSSHFLVRAPGAKTKKFIDPFTGQMIVEIRSTGSQSVVPSSIHPSGEPYEWERQDAPVLLDASQLEAMVGEIAAAAFVATLWTGSRHNLALALAGHLVKRQIPQDRATRLMQLIVDATADNEPVDRLRAVTDTYRRFQDGDEISADLSVFLKDDAQIKAFIKTLDLWLDTRRRHFRIHSEQVLLSRPAAAFLVSGLLVQGSLVALVANPNVGKTFLANDLALHVAAGEPTWLGRKLHAQGPVLYVIGEGIGRFKYRVLAWKQTHATMRALPFYSLDEPVPLLDSKMAKVFIKEVAPLKPAVVILDTLSRCLMGGNENSQEDMGKAIAVCDELRARTGCLVMILHHMKKDGTVERGSTVLRGAADTMLLLKEETRGVLTLSCEKQKDADAFEPISLVRRTIQIEDSIEPETGEPASSCVIRMATDTDLAKATTRQRIIDFLHKHPDASKNEVTKGVGGRRETVLSEIDNLKTEGAIRVSVAGKKTYLRMNDLPLPASEDF